MADTLRVRIDVQRVRRNMQMHGRELTEAEIQSWLKTVGFTPEADGRTWLTDAANLRCLDKSEIVEVRPVA